MKRLIKLMLMILIILGTAPLFAQTSQGSKKMNDMLRLRLTHTLFQGVIASYFVQNDKKFDAKYLADKAFLQTFLNEWSIGIDLGSYESTEQIFNAISNNKAYLFVYSDKWKSISQFTADKNTIDLGGIKNQFLGQVLIAEKKYKNIDQQIQYILQAVNTYLVTNAQEYELAQLIAGSFLDNKNETTRKYAEQIFQAVPFQKNVQLAIAAFDILAMARGSTGFLSVFNLPKYQKITRLAAIPLVYTGRAIQSGAAKAVNPIFSKMTSLHWSMIASGGIHATGIGAGALYVMDNVQAITSSKSKLQPNIISTGLLWETFKELYKDSFTLQEFHDFFPHFELGNKEDLVKDVDAHLNQGKPIDYFSTFLKAEKFTKIDNRDLKDQFATNFINNRYNELKYKVDQLFRSGIGMKQIGQFRQLVIEEAIHNYKRDYPNLTSLLLSWGGNCVSSTMLVTSLLEPYKEKLAANGYKLAIGLYPDHIEPALILTDGRYLDLVGGKLISHTKVTIKKPSYLMVLLARHLDLPIKNSEDSIIDKAIALIAPIKTKDKKDERKGVLEKFSPFDVNSDTPLFALDEIPYSSTIEYSEIFEQTHFMPATYGQLSNAKRSKFKEPDIKFELLADQGLFENKKNMLIDFIYDVKKSKVIAFDEEIYSELLTLSRQFKGNRSGLQRVLSDKLLAKFDQAKNHPIMQKFYEAPSNKGLVALSDISDLEISQHDQLLRELNFIINIFNNTAYDEDALASSIPELYKNYSGYQINRFDSVSSIINAEAKNQLNIIKSPGAFLELYNQSSSLMRRHLIARFFNSSIFTGDQNLYRYPSNNQSQAKSKVRDFIRNANHIKVDFSKENSFICNPIAINLPTISQSWPWAYNFSKDNCQKELKNSKNDPDQSQAENSEIQRKNLLELKVSTLIELTVLFGRGLHLWNEEVVDAFVEGRYEKVLTDRPTSITQLRNILASDPQLASEPRFRPLHILVNTVPDVNNVQAQASPAPRIGGMRSR